MSSVAREFGQSERMAIYEIADDQLAVGSTLGGPKAACIIKATGALQTVYATDTGVTAFGSVVLRHYDDATGMHLAADGTGTFVIHPEHQEHVYSLPNAVQVHETVFVLSGKPGDDGQVDPPGVYLSVKLQNHGPDTARIQTYAFADLRGNTAHDIVAEFDKKRSALLAWNEAQPCPVRLFGCSDAPQSYETTLDTAKSVSGISPGALSNTTDAPGDPLGAMQHVREIPPNGSVHFHYLLSFGKDKAEARRNYQACPPADEALQKTKAYYSETLSRAVVVTPNPNVNRGVLWAKANMLRVMLRSPTGWCFVNDPTRSNNTVGRDTAWFAYGGDWLRPDFVRESLMGYVRTQEPSGKIVEYYDIRDGKSADYDLNINDDTPLIVLALWHHYNTTGDEGFLQEIYPAAAKAARHILSQRNDQGLVWCSATGTSDWGIASWRNVITGYTLSGAVTEINSECYAALRTVAQMARVLGKHDESAELAQEAQTLKNAINTHLRNPANGLYYLNIDVNGHPHSDITSDLVFPVMFDVADDETAARIISRLSDDAFWTGAGIRTVPRDAPNYDPDGPNWGSYGLMGGVWLGVSFWFAFAAARYNPEFMDHALSASFRNFSSDPRRNNTVPGQFSEWLHGETLTNEGMMLSPWDPPRYLWAAVEGAAGLDITDGQLSLSPRLASDWKWMGVSNLPYRGRRLTWFAVRAPDLQVYANFHPHGGAEYRAYDEDITTQVSAGLDTVTVMGFRQDDNLVVFAGNKANRTVQTSVQIDFPLAGAYRVRVYESLLRQWADRGVVSAESLARGHVLQIERKGFSLLELTQEA